MPLLRASNSLSILATLLFQSSLHISLARSGVAEGPYTAPINPNTIVSSQKLEITPHLVNEIADNRRIPAGVGSGLATIATTGDTAIVVALSDRGPNISLGESKKRGEPEKVIFPVTRYIPLLYPFIIQGSSVAQQGAPFTLPVGLLPAGVSLNIESLIPLLSENGIPFSGLPATQAEECAVGPDLAKLSVAKTELALDPEAVTYDRSANKFWIAEEYGPSIVAIDPSSWRAIERLTPGAGLPAILRHRAPNRGFEGLTQTPKGNLAAILQSPLVDPTTGSAERFVRLIIRSAAPNTRLEWQSYALAVPNNAEPDSYKIGELVALSNERFLALESFKDRAGSKRYHLLALELSGTKPIDSERILSEGIDDSSAITRKVLINFADFSWDSGKIEGLTLLNESRTLLIAKDNDFGIELVKEAKRGKKLQGKSENARVEFKDTSTELLLIELSKNIEQIS